MSSSNVATGLNSLPSKRVTYIVFGNQPPITRWSRNIGKYSSRLLSVVSRKAEM